MATRYQIKWKDGAKIKCDGTKEPNSLHDLIDITKLGDYPNRMFICRWCGVKIIELLNTINGSSEYYYD